MHRIVSSNIKYVLQISHQKPETRNFISDVLTAFTSSFCNYHTVDALAYETVPPFSREKVLNNDAKNNLICESAVAMAVAYVCK